MAWWESQEALERQLAKGFNANETLFLGPSASSHRRRRRILTMLSREWTRSLLTTTETVHASTLIEPTFNLHNRGMRRSMPPLDIGLHAQGMPSQARALSPFDVLNYPDERVQPSSTPQMRCKSTRTVQLPSWKTHHERMDVMSEFPLSKPKGIPS